MEYIIKTIQIKRLKLFLKINSINVSNILLICLYTGVNIIIPLNVFEVYLLAGGRRPTDIALGKTKKITLQH